MLTGFAEHSASQRPPLARGAPRKQTGETRDDGNGGTQRRLAGYLRLHLSSPMYRNPTGSVPGSAKTSTVQPSHMGHRVKRRDQCLCGGGGSSWCGGPEQARSIEIRRCRMSLGNCPGAKKKAAIKKGRRGRIDQTQSDVCVHRYPIISINSQSWQQRVF